MLTVFFSVATCLLFVVVVYCGLSLLSFMRVLFVVVVLLLRVVGGAARYCEL